MYNLSMKVFFGGSLPGFKENKKDYIEIRKAIIASKNKLTRDWISEELEDNPKRSHSEMYELTEKAIKTADAVILEYSDHISAVGQQLILSLEQQLPTLLLIKDVYRAKMISSNDLFIGSKHRKYLRKEKYTEKSIKNTIEDFLKWAEDNKKLVRFNLELPRELDDYLKDKSKENNSSKSEEIRKLIQADISTTS